jgi:hypothetical protein
MSRLVNLGETTRLGSSVDLEAIRMPEKKDAQPKQHRETGGSQIIGFRLPVPLAKAIKLEAGRRQMPLNVLLIEMWQLYRDAKRAG